MKVVIIRTQEQFEIIKCSLLTRGIRTKYLDEVQKKYPLPIAINPEDGGWTKDLDRAIDHMEFDEYSKHML